MLRTLDSHIALVFACWSACLLEKQHMASSKKKIVECSACRRIMKVCTDVETTLDADHLYVMSASNSLLPGLVKIGRSKNPLQRAIDLQESQPYHIKIHALFWGLGWREKEVHKNLASCRVEDAPGQEWFELPAQNACIAISRILFADMPKPRRIAEDADD